MKSDIGWLLLRFCATIVLSCLVGRIDCRQVKGVVAGLVIPHISLLVVERLPLPKRLKYRGESPCSHQLDFSMFNDLCGSFIFSAVGFQCQLVESNSLPLPQPVLYGVFPGTFFANN